MERALVRSGSREFATIPKCDNRDMIRQILSEIQYVLTTKYITILPAVIALALSAVSYSVRGTSFPISSKTLMGIAMVLWILMIMMIFYQTTVTCPNCKKPFNIREKHMVRGYNPFRLKCGSCGLRADGKNIADLQITE